MKTILTALLAITLSCSVSLEPKIAQSFDSPTATQTIHEFDGMKNSSLSDAIFLARAEMEVNTAHKRFRIPSKAIQDIKIPDDCKECTDHPSKFFATCNGSNSEPQGCGISLKISNKWFTFLSSCETNKSLLFKISDSRDPFDVEVTFQSMIVTKSSDSELYPFFVNATLSVPNQADDDDRVPSLGLWELVIPVEMLEGLSFKPTASGCQESPYTPGLVTCPSVSGTLGCSITFKMSDKWYIAVKKCDGLIPILTTVNIDGILCVTILYDKLRECPPGFDPDK